MNRRILIIPGMLIMLGCCQCVWGLTMEWVVVGDEGNLGDTEIMRDGSSGYGSVPYTFLIGRYEVTNSQYCEFLNAIAASDPHGLYNPEMALSQWGGIVKGGNEGTFFYSVKAGCSDKPVNYVDWYDCLRFANWMHNGHPEGVQDASTTEDGAYTFTDTTTVGPCNEHALVWLTSEDEWYKAAYYKAGSVNAGYWDYATGSDTMPDREPPPGGNNSANAYPAGNEIQPVGAYINSPSPYGTFDQNGNLSEWTETQVGPTQWVVRGGSYDVMAIAMAAASRGYNLPDYPEAWNRGFRVASAHSGGGNECDYLLLGDLNKDCRVDLTDLAIMAGNWLIDCHVDPSDLACALLQ